VPFVLSVSARDPASIQTPTVDVCAHGEYSVAIYHMSAACAVRLSSSPYRQAVGESGRFRLQAIFHDRSREASLQWCDCVEGSATAESLGEVES
jgi:hypothetical protein